MLDTCFAYILVYSWLWIFKWFITTWKYVVMVIISIFVGPGKTIHRLAVSNTERKTGMPYQVTPDLFKVEKITVFLWMLWSSVYLLSITVMIVGGWLGANAVDWQYYWSQLTAWM
jgi:hypothetical protein